LEAWNFFGLIGTMIDHAGGLPELRALISEDPEGACSIDMAFTDQIIEIGAPGVQKQFAKADWAVHLEFYIGVVKVVQHNAGLPDFNLPGKPMASQQRTRVILSVKSCVRAFLRKFGSISISQSMLQ
jgi:hypothetical protein